MDIDNIKKTETWKYLCSNPKFEEEFRKTVKRYSYYVNINELKFEIRNTKIVVSYESKINNRDLDSQFKLFAKMEFFLDDNNYLIVNEMKGNLESNYGHDFENTPGGKLNTSYSCWVYDTDGIELSYQAYGDQYTIDKETFDAYKNDFSSIVLETYNPNLITVANKAGSYCRPDIIGNNANFIRQIRDKNSLGIVEVSKCSFDKNNGVNNAKEEYYFNTFFGSNSSYTPDLMHIISGYPFAVIDEDHVMRLKDDYTNLGLTDGNYRDVARERFLKELREYRPRHAKDLSTSFKYDVMIDKLEKEINAINRK